MPNENELDSPIASPNKPIQNTQSSRPDGPRKSRIRFSFGGHNRLGNLQDVLVDPKSSWSSDPSKRTGLIAHEAMTPIDGSAPASLSPEEMRFIFSTASDVSEYFDADEWQDPSPGPKTPTTMSEYIPVGPSHNFEGNMKENIEGSSSTDTDTENEDEPTVLSQQESSIGSASDSGSGTPTESDLTDRGDDAQWNATQHHTCRATLDDSIRVKCMAFKLLRYTESNEIIGNLIHRLERMADMESVFAIKNDVPGRHASYHAGQLRSFLYKTRVGRVRTGENTHYIAHELEWADWLLEATQTEVVHFPGPGCSCSSHWTID